MLNISFRKTLPGNNALFTSEKNYRHRHSISQAAGDGFVSDVQPAMLTNLHSRGWHWQYRFRYGSSFLPTKYQSQATIRSSSSHWLDSRPVLQHLALSRLQPASEPRAEHPDQKSSRTSIDSRCKMDWFPSPYLLSADFDVRVRISSPMSG